MLKHPYPDHAYLERDAETNEKRWFSCRGMGVRYIHEDRAAEDVEAAVAAERLRCRSIVANLAGADIVYPEGMRMIIEAIDNPPTT
jgi:hypothetical protein